MSFQWTGHFCLLVVSQSQLRFQSLPIRGKLDFDPTLQQEKFVPSCKISNILTYIQVAPATTDVQSLLEIPATDEIYMEDRNHGLA